MEEIGLDQQHLDRCQRRHHAESKRKAVKMPLPVLIDADDPGIVDN